MAQLTNNIDDVLLAKLAMNEQDELRAATGQTEGAISYTAVAYTPVAFTQRGQVD